MTFKQATGKDYTAEIELLNQVLKRLDRDEDEIPQEDRDFNVTGWVLQHLEMVKGQLSR